MKGLYERFYNSLYLLHSFKEDQYENKQRETMLTERKEAEHISKITESTFVHVESKRCFILVQPPPRLLLWHRYVRKRVVMLDKAALLNSESILNWNMPALLPVFSTTTAEVENFKVFRVSLIILHQSGNDKNIFLRILLL